MNNYFAENLRYLRAKNNLDQSQIGEIIGRGRNMVSTYESGASKPNVEILLVLADFFKINLNDLVTSRLADHEGQPEKLPKSIDDVSSKVPKSKSPILLKEPDAQYASTLWEIKEVKNLYQQLLKVKDELIEAKNKEIEMLQKEIKRLKQKNKS